MDMSTPDAWVRRRRTRAAFVSLLTLYGVTTVHHVYGGITDGSANRLSAPFVVLVPVGVAVVALVRFRRTGSRAAAWVYTGVACVLMLGLGLVHSAYSHIYKDVLYLLGGPSSAYVLINPEEHYPPDDVFFEVTGILELGVAVWVLVAALRLLTPAGRGAGTNTEPEPVPEAAP